MLEKIKKHKKLVIVLVVIVIVAIVAGIVVTKMKNNAGEITKEENGIQAFSLAKQDMTSSVSTSGTVESGNVTEVTTEVNSAIKELNVSLGDHVEKGQVLCTFDDEEIKQQIADLEKQNGAAQKANASTIQKAQRAVDTASAQVNAKTAALAAAQNDYQTIQNMLGNGDQSAENKSAALASAQANVQSAQGELDGANQSLIAAQEALEDAKNTTVDNSSSSDHQLRQQLNNLTVVASQSVITQLNVSKGSIPANGSLMRIEDDTTLKVNVNIKEKDILKLAAGQKASISSDAIGSDQVFSGTVDKVVNFASKSAASDGSGSTSTSGYSATIALEPGTPLLLGMSVNVEILLNEEGEQLAVPYDAISQDDDGSSYVMVGEKKDNGKYKVKKVTVTPGVSNNYYTAITSDDLKEGDTIINYPYEVEEGEEVELYFPENDSNFAGTGDDATGSSTTDSSTTY